MTEGGAGKAEEVVMVDGSPVTPDHQNIDPETGMQKGYVVLSPEERARGFIRPVRLAYRHVGPPGPAGPLRDLTEEEKKTYGDLYAKFETYGPERSPVMGRFWTWENLDRAERGCGKVTTMDRAIAETYARDPAFYGGTFCAGCRAHFPVGERGEFVWEGTSERVGT